MKASKPQKLASNIERRNMHPFIHPSVKLTVEFHAADRRPSRRIVRTREASKSRASKTGSASDVGKGLYDLHGNVREWCSDAYHAVHSIDEAKEGTSSRVTCGWSH